MRLEYEPQLHAYAHAQMDTMYDYAFLTEIGPLFHPTSGGRFWQRRHGRDSFISICSRKGHVCSRAGKTPAVGWRRARSRRAAVGSRFGAGISTTQWTIACPS